MPEERISSERVFDGKLIGVRVDRVRQEDGRLATREVVEHPGAVAILPVHDDGTLVLVRQFRYAVGRTLLEVPAGTREPGEPELETARRELREECGLEAEQIEELARYAISPGWCNESIVIYRASGLREVGAQPDEGEQIEIVHVQPGEIAALIASGEIGDAKTITSVLLVLDLTR